MAEFRSLTEAEELASVKNKKGAHDANNVLRERDANTPTRNGFQPDPDDHDDHAGDENEPVDHSSVSNASTNTSLKSGKSSKAEIRAAKREAKAAKSQRKSLKNQTKHIVAVKAADVEHVSLILHGEHNLDDSHPLASDKCIEDVMNRNRKFVSYIAEHKAILLKEVANNRRLEMEQRARKARKRKDRESISNYYGDATSHHKAQPAAMDEDEEALVNAVLTKFDIPVDIASDGSMTPTTPVTPKRASGGSRASSQEKAMVLAQLRIAIAEDLKKHENEQRQTCIRASGFWRYANQQIFDRMMGITEKIDWKTGAIKKAGGSAWAMSDGLEAAGAVDVDDVEGIVADDVQEWVEDVAVEVPV